MNLPTPPTPLLGRQLELAATCGLLQRDDVRLLTLTGPAGTGKTRLALAVAAELSTKFPDGVWFAELASINDSALVVSTIAQMLAAGERTGESPLETLKKHLHDKRLLLVLDNFEQLLAAAPLVSQLPASCPELRVLVTSRAALHLSGEHQYPVSPLELPELVGQLDLEALVRCPSVALFLQRAQAVEPDFQLNPSNAPAVAEICVRVDGLPLAIELAAARIRMLAPRVLARRLGQRLDLLTGGPRDTPVRQQTLRAAIDWSYDLLGADQRSLLTRLAVFVGGFTLEAALAVCVKDQQSADDLFANLTALVEHSLLQHAHGTDGDGRFAMLETIREYAIGRLVASGQAAEVHRRHAEYFLALAAHAERLPLHPVRRWRSDWFGEVAQQMGGFKNEPEWGRKADGLARATPGGA